MTTTTAGASSQEAVPAPTLVHFATMTITLGESFTVKGGPAGTRLIAEVDSVELSGEKLTASMVGKSAADWLIIGPDKSYGTLDVRLTLKTADDAIIYMAYSGRINLATGQAVSAPLFETSSDDYDWLNRIQAVGNGLNGPENLVYELYEVRP